MPERKQLHEAFEVHMLPEDGKAKARAIAEEFDALRQSLVDRGVDGRYLSIVTTKLEEACFFAKKGLASKTGIVLALVFCFLPGLAFAADVAPSPATGLGAKLLELVVSPTGLGVLASGVGGLLVLIAGTNEVRRRRVALAVYHAFHVVEDVSAETETGIDDKVAEGLKALDAYLVANGWRALKPGEVAAAKLGFTSLNGAAKLSEKIAANAQVEAAKALSSGSTTVPPTP